VRFARALAGSLAGSLAALSLAGCGHRRGAPPPEEPVEVQGRIVTDPAPGHEGGKPCEPAAEPRRAEDPPRRPRGPGAAGE